MTVLRPLPPRWDSFRTYALENADGTNDFFFARVHCSRSAAQDIFKVVDP